tara:strand:+ start:3597 stop:4016 length:420 start_codon:yes stop_codon:yes gene_type:complete
VVVAGSDSRGRSVGIAGRSLGVIASVGAIVLWVIFIFQSPYIDFVAGPQATITPDGQLIFTKAMLFGSLMILASSVSAVASVRGAHLAMYMLFAVSFFPVGVYVMLGPGIFQAIGWLNLIYLVSALIVHVDLKLFSFKS